MVGLVRDHNKTGGYMCTSCAWAKPAKPHTAVDDGIARSMGGFQVIDSDIPAALIPLWQFA